jgi:hypothetical protein
MGSQMSKGLRQLALPSMTTTERFALTVVTLYAYDEDTVPVYRAGWRTLAKHMGYYDRHKDLGCAAACRLLRALESYGLLETLTPARPRHTAVYRVCTSDPQRAHWR